MRLRHLVCFCQALCDISCSRLQGSRDNMSIVIVALPDAPTVSDEVIKADADCSERLVAHVKKMYTAEPEIDTASIVHAIAVNEVAMAGLPPGGGVHTK